MKNRHKKTKRNPAKAMVIARIKLTLITTTVLIKLKINPKTTPTKRRGIILPVLPKVKIQVGTLKRMGKMISNSR